MRCPECRKPMRLRRQLIWLPGKPSRRKIEWVCRNRECPRHVRRLKKRGSLFKGSPLIRHALTNRTCRATPRPAEPCPARPHLPCRTAPSLNPPELTLPYLPDHAAP